MQKFLKKILKISCQNYTFAIFYREDRYPHILITIKQLNSMRLFNTRITVACISFLLTTSIFANKGQEVLDTGTVKQQFDFVLEKSSTYEQYKVIKKSWARKLRNHVLDSLNLANKRYQESLFVISQKQEEIDSLAFQIEQTTSRLESAITEKNSIKLFGLLLSKTTYNSILWGLILVLTTLLSIIFLMFKRSNKITIRTKKDLDETREEYETHRKKAREREEKMARKHLDEILKYKKNETSWNT